MAASQGGSRSLWLRAGLCAFACALLCLAVQATAIVPESRANSWVAAAPGLVRFTGDNNRHQLVVTTSKSDVSIRAWSLRDVAAAVGIGARAPQIAATVREMTQHIGHVLQADQVIAESAVLVDELPPQIKSLGIEVNATSASAAAGEVRAAALAEFLAAEVKAGRTVPAEALANLSEVTSQAKAAIERFLWLEDEMIEKMTSLSLSEKMIASLEVHRVRALRRALGVTVKFAGHLARIYVFAEGLGSLSSIFTAGRVIIQDTAGNPIDAAWPCTDRVRQKDSSTPLQNAVSCPAAYAPSLFSGLKSTLQITGGSGTDIVNLNLDPQNNALTAVLVEGNEGDDLIAGSFADDQLSGGRGADVIFGGGGNDSIEGYGPFYTLEGQTDLGDSGDKLVGGDGEDEITGNSGNDLMAGGVGDDQVAGGTGNDSLIGGAGDDGLIGGSGRDAIFARESDFPGGVDEIDSLITCEYRSGITPNQPAKTSPSVNGKVEIANNCTGVPRSAPSASQFVKNPIPADGIWPWFP